MPIKPEQPVLCCKAAEVQDNTGQTNGMKRMVAFSGVNDHICASGAQLGCPEMHSD